MKCLIWGTDAEDKGNLDDPYFKVLSHRTGGGYRLASNAQHLVSKLSEDNKKKLTTWLIRQRRFGEEFPLITQVVIESLSTQDQKLFVDRVNDALLFFSIALNDFTKQLHLASSRDDFKPLHLMATTACKDLNELRSFLHLMVAAGLLTAHGAGLDSFALTPGGWERIDRLQQALPSTSQAFVAMWFDTSTVTAYSEGLEPAIRDSGYFPLRIDRKEHINKVDDEIIAEIRKSRFLVADFTCEPHRVRGGVYFEAGFAMALPIPVIWTCHKDSINDLHFDTRQYVHVLWKEPLDLYTQLKARIGAVIGQGPLATAP